MDELGHAYHDAAIRRGTTAAPTDNAHLPDQKVNGKTGYHRENHYEYQAHRIVDPAIGHYINGGLGLRTIGKK